MRSKKQRIAFTINKDGFWVVAGWADASEAELSESVFESNPDGILYWIEVDIAAPESTVKGNVL